MKGREPVLYGCHSIHDAAFRKRRRQFFPRPLEADDTGFGITEYAGDLFPRP
jgi:hypothetical protein